MNETLTQSHTQPVVVGGSHVLDLTVLIEHQDNPDVMAVTVRTYVRVGRVKVKWFWVLPKFSKWGLVP